jgi:glycosyltransferase involved in cell wall biosynthesis
MIPNISVILPFYNAGRWLQDALQSLRRQDCEGIEVIAVDDGSSDGGCEIARREHSPRLPIKLIKNPANLGIVESLNIGLTMAQGRFIARMDADDICTPDRLSEQLAFLSRTGCDICGSWFTEFGQGIPRRVRWPSSETAVRAGMLFQNTLCHPTVMARREVFERLSYREGYAPAEDYDLFGRATAAFRIANIPKVLLHYRRHAQQATQAKRDVMEAVTRRIRVEILHSRGIRPSTDEARFHNMIRAPYSIRSVEDLHGIEKWLLKLLAAQDELEARQVVSSQWIRACIRAAPLGKLMWTTFRDSPLRRETNATMATHLDLAVLAATRLDYRSAPFMTLRRLGLSA